MFIRVGMVWGHSNLDLWDLRPTNFNQFILECMNVFARFEGLPSRCSWDIPFTRMGLTTRKHNDSGHGCRQRGGRTKCGNHHALTIFLPCFPCTPLTCHLNPDWSSPSGFHEHFPGLTAKAAGHSIDSHTPVKHTHKQHYDVMIYLFRY